MFVALGVDVAVQVARVIWAGVSAILCGALLGVSRIFSVIAQHVGTVGLVLNRVVPVHVHSQFSPNLHLVDVRYYVFVLLKV